MPYLRLLVVALALCAAASAQTPIDGVLVAPDGTPYANALVTVESGRTGPGVADSTRTDAEGRFQLAVTAPGGLTVRVGGEPLWLPLPIDGDRQPLTLRLTVPQPFGSGSDYLDDFAAVSSDPALAATLDVFVAAERGHRTPVSSPALDAAVAAADSALAAAPLDRKNAVRDSLRARFQPLYAAAPAPRIEAYAGALPDEAPPLVRAAHALWGVFRINPDSAAAARLIREVPPTSPLWSYQGLYRSGVNNVLFLMTRHLAPQGAPIPEPVEDYLRALAYDYPDPNVRAQASGVLVQGLRWTGNDEKATAAVDRLLREFPDSRQAESIRRDEAEDRRVRPGQPLPDFAFPALTDSTAVITTVDLRGTTFLLDFWGTWCGPCVEELPRLHELYQLYRDDGLEIVSVATFDSAEAVAAFREKGFPMPWRHALLPDAEMEPVRETFEFTGIPAYILVGPDGVILAEGGGARGEDLAAALADHLAGE